MTIARFIFFPVSRSTTRSGALKDAPRLDGPGVEIWLDCYTANGVRTFHVAP